MYELNDNLWFNEITTSVQIDYNLFTNKFLTDLFGITLLLGDS
jgi:hypothetical protein